MAARARSLAPIVLALLLTGGSTTLARAESDWVESVFADKEKEPRGGKAARRPPASPARLVKPARRAGSEDAAVRRREQQDEKKQAERESERGGQAHKNANSTPQREPPSSTASVPPGSVDPVPKFPSSSVATSDEAQARMRLGGPAAAEPIAPPFGGSMTAPLGPTQPLVQPSWLPAPSFGATVSPALPAQIEPHAQAAASSQPATPAREAARAPPREIGATGQSDRNTTSLREREPISPDRASADRPAAMPASVAILAPAPKSTMAATALDTREPEARGAAIARGQRLWMERRGPRQASLDACDLGLGPGRVVGTFAHLPRYFADAGRVMDLETRIAWCARVLQEREHAALIQPRAVDGAMASEMEDLAVYVASLSASWRLSAPLTHVGERQAYEVGQALYARRQGPLDFSCAACHGAATSAGDPIAAASAQAIKVWQGRTAPLLDAPANARMSIGNWPAWRAGHGGIQTLQGRLVACFGLMGVQPPSPGSDAVVALVAYLTRQADKAEVLAPGRKR